MRPIFFPKISIVVSLLALSCPIPLVNSIPLLGGRFETTTDVQSLLNLGLDAADMRETTNLTTKASIYKEGVQRDGSGSSVVTLQSLSLNAKDTMATSPMYNFFRHAFLVLGNANEGEKEGSFDGHPIEQYGDTLVNDLFSLNYDDIETEAALVTIVWMEAVYELFQVLQQCKAQDATKGLAALDKAAALWIGEGQVEGSNDEGHLLYFLAENAGERFGQDDGESWVNTQIMDRFIELQADLQSDVCSTTEGFVGMRKTVRRMVGLMTVPLVQNFIHYSRTVQSTEMNGHFVELYALATFPRIAACNPASYDEVLRLAVFRDVSPNQVDTIIKVIQKAYTCLDISCDDVGAYLGGVVPACKDTTTAVAAGYETNRSGAVIKSRLDRDIKAIDIFLRFEAYGAAEEWYTYGWNADGYTLKDVALNAVIPAVSENSYIASFQAYYSGDDFADTMFTNIVQLVPPFNSASGDQVRNMAIGLLKYVVMFMTSATALQYAVEQCNVDQTTALEFWDTGALFYIGSMEGEDDDGNKFDGELIYAAANDLCGEFGTCASLPDNSDNVAVASANEKVVQGLNKSVALINSGSCDDLKTMLGETILPTMIIPLFQGTIKYASYNAGLAAGTTDSSLAIGDTFSRGILPLIDKSSSDSAATITSNMQFQLSTKPVADGFSAVADALRTAIKGMPTPCGDIGQFEDEPSDGYLCQDGGASDSGGGGTTDNIAWGRYVFQSLDAAEDGTFALDVRDMHRGSLSDASTIYTNGTNNIERGLFGNGGVKSLAAFSTDLVDAMAAEPMYNIYRYALYDDGDIFDPSADTFTFAHDVVTEALTGGKNHNLAAYAAVVMNVWMVIVHRLYEAQQACDVGGEPVPYIDSAVALWIGKEQQEGKFEQGWMLYSIAQSAAQNFGLEEKEANVNTVLMQRFNDLQETAATCNTEEGNFSFYFQVHELVRTLSKPLILAFLSSLYNGSKNMVQLYGVAILPQAFGCDDAIGENLESVFVNNYSTDKVTDDVKEQLAAFLRCQRITSEDLTSGSTIDTNLSALLKSLDTRLNYYLDTSPFLPMAGYKPNSDVSEIARLDLDALQIWILIKTQAYEAANDLFKYGRNAYSAGDSVEKYMSLYSLNRAKATNVPLHEVYVKYYGSASFGEDIITAAIEQSGEFVSATAAVRAEIVFRTIQGIYSFMAALVKMYSSLDSCVSQDMEAAQNDWDSSVALYIGSSEGLLAGGRQGSGGSFMYSLSEEICDDLDVCGAGEETIANQGLIMEFAYGRDAVNEGKCDFLERLIEDEVIPKLVALLVQSFLVFSIQSDVGADLYKDDALAAEFIFSKALLPLIDKVNSTSAATIERNFGSFDTVTTTTQNLASITTALAYSLRGLAITCEEVGTPVDNPDYTLCMSTQDGTTDSGNVPGQVPNPDTPTDLGDGIYVSSTYVQDRANIAKDISDIQEALSSNSINLAKLVYEDGKNSQIYDENGKFTGLRSLKSFSTEETSEMLDEPLFNIFLYALQNKDGTFMSKKVQMYANSLVEDAFKNASGKTAMLPVEAMLAFNLWMHIAHSLYTTLKICKNKEIHDDEGISSIDIAAAYWIGDGQVAGSGENGHLLYAMAERMGVLFNMDVGGQSRTNTNILKQFNEAKHEISLPGSCSDSASSYQNLSRIANTILSLMAIPLIQNLIHSLREDDRPRVKLYAHAVVPLAASCGPGPFEYLKGKVLNVSYNAGEVEEIVSKIRSLYPCLGLTCSDIGVHEKEMTDSSMACKDPDPMASLAGYKPASPVSDYARIDLDMRQLDILLEMKAYAAAENLYTHGKHVQSADVDSISLFQLATTSERKIVPQYDAFVRYYGNKYDDPSNYADHIIRSALQDSEGQKWTDAQRKVIVLRSAQVLVMYFGALQALFEAISDCSSSSSVGTTGYSTQWDRGAAMLIGSLEGSKTNGTQEGYMFYDLAQEYCTDFGTCKDVKTGVTINEELVTLLYTGRGAALSNNCGQLRKAASEISTLLLVPIIEGALYSAIHIARSKGTEAELHRANGYVYSRAVLPLVAGANTDASQIIDKQLGFPPPSSTRNLVSDVFSAFAKAYPSMNVDCEDIGDIEGNDPCDGVVYGSDNTIWIVIGSVLGAIFLCICYILWRRRRKVAKLPENNPRFVTSETGELNHSMDLLEKAFSSTSRVCTPDSGETVALAEDMHNDASPLDDDDFEEITALKSKMDSSDADII